jgi:1,4-dihydroxy-2-naphthoate octaprenyltransferase
MSEAKNIWLLGARPKTLGAAIAPVLVGTAVAAPVVELSVLNGALALIVGLAMQVGVNYANDYSDGIKGSDDVRVGPVRLVASGLATATAVKRAAIISFLVAAVAGLLLAYLVNWWLIALGAASIVAAWFYTGGKSPYGYRGFGELSVFVFFGLVATVGSYYVQTELVSIPALAAGTSLGLLSMALLIVNNLRDLVTDKAANKQTLAVKLGDRRTRLFYLISVIGAIMISMTLALAAPFAALSGLLILVAMQPIRDVVAGATGKDLIQTLQQTNQLLIWLGIILAISFLLA